LSGVCVLTEFAIHIIAALGVIQGVVLLVAAHRARNLNPTGFACLMIALVGVLLIIVEEWIVFSGAWRTLPHILRSTTWMPYLIGPSLWLFARSLQAPFELRWSRLHFLPAALACLYFLPFYVQSGAAKIAFVEGTHVIPLETSLHGAAKALSMLGYLLATLVVLRRLPRTALSRSVFWTIAAFLVFVIAVASNFLTEHITSALPISSDLLAIIGLAIFLYSLSLLVLIYWREFATAFRTADADAPSAPRAPALLDADTTQILFADVEQRVAKLGLHLEPQMTVTRLSSALELQPHYLSFVVNASTGMNVKAWLNGLRVTEAKSRLIDQPDKSVIEIGLDCGFNSKAALNRAFRSATGQSPTEFRAAHFPK
jgi:AraC-like DNA-binding protein